MVRHLLNPSVKTTVTFSIHSITPPLLSKPIITVPRPPCLPLEDPWVASDSYLVGNPGLSTFKQSEPNLGSLPFDEVKRPDSQNCY